MRSRHLLVALGVAAALFVAGIAAVAGLVIWREASLPVYTMAQERSPDGERVTETLTLNGVLYVSSLSEFPLEPTGRGRPIGKTDGGLRVYATAGQGADDRYVILAGFMFPDTIYRRADVATFDLESFPITELRMAVNKGRGLEMHTTQDAALIAEVLARLKEPGPLVAATEPYDNYRVELRSPQAPGVYYLLYCVVAGDGRVFLAERATPESWLAAGEGLAQWVRRATE